MSLAAGSSPEGTEFYDTEGITYVGGGKFVLDPPFIVQTHRPSNSVRRLATPATKASATTSSPSHNRSPLTVG
jgi:hypothetical protein